MSTPAGPSDPPLTPAVTPIVVYHVAAMGNWQEVVWEQLGLLRAVGLTAVRVTHVGDGLDWLRAAFARSGVEMHLVRSDPDTGHCETLAMLEVERLARVERVGRPVLYLHTKGVSDPAAHDKWLWRRVMEEHVVRRWPENVAALADHDAVGVNWQQDGEQHFSGTFWIARPDWLRRLPDFAEYHDRMGRVRYSCEKWIGAAPGCRAKSLACGDHPFWMGGYDFRRLLLELPGGRPAQPPPVRPRLTVVTACTRPRNLPYVGRSVDTLREHFDVTWVVVADLDRVPLDAVRGRRPDVLVGEPGDGAGMAQKNRGLREAGPGWVYFLDDDNALHPAFPDAAAAAIAAHPHHRVLVFGQRDRGGGVRLDAGPVRWARIDVGNVLVHTSVVGDARFAAYPGAVGDDFVFVRHIYDRSPEAFAFVNAYCTYYNGLPDFGGDFPGCPVPLLQDEWEWAELMALFDRVRPARVLEIGSLYGGSLWHWLSRGWVDEVASVDLPPAPTEPWYDPLWHGEFLAESQARWAGWVEGRPDRLVLFRGDSRRRETIDRVREHYRDRPPAWLFIDGDHGYEAVRSDWERYAPLVRPGGHVVFHDVVGLAGVARLWGEIQRRCRTITLHERGGSRGIGTVVCDGGG